MQPINRDVSVDFNRRGISTMSVQPQKYQPHSIAHPTYIPSVDVHHHQDLPDAIVLMNQRTRFYFKPEPVVYEENKDGVSVSIATSRRSGHGSTRKSEEAFESEPLDLGIVQLRRIIEQIRGLKSKSKVSTFNPLASRAAGMPTYTEYLHGTVTAEMHMAELLKDINKSKSYDTYA